MKFNLFSSLLFLVLLSYTPRYSSHRPIVTPQVTNDELVKICAKAQSPTFCYDTLKSDNRTESADVRELTFIAVGVATANAFGTFFTLGEYIKLATDPTLRSRYQLCYEVYYTMTDLLVKARDDSTPFNPIVVVDLVSSVLYYVHKCHDQFSSPPAGADNLKTRGDKLVQYCDIIMIVNGYESVGA